jgi:hypothetical protein
LKLTGLKRIGASEMAVPNFIAKSRATKGLLTFNGIVLKGNKLIAAAKLMYPSDGLADKVAADAGGIGYAGFAYIRGAKALSIATDCGLTFPPSDFFVRTEEYPPSRRLFLYAPATPTNGESHNFIEYALGAARQDQVGKKGFVDLVPQLSTDAYTRGVTPKLATGYGKAAPVACNSTPEVLEKNRRVEIWIH